MRRVWMSCAAGFATAVVAAALLWAAQERFGDPLTAALLGGEGWQRGKAVFFPLLAGAPVVWWAGRGGSRAGLCATAILAAAVAPITAPLPIAIAWPLTVAAALTLYGGALRRLPERWGWCVAAVALAASYILLTLAERRGALATMQAIPF